MDISEYFKLRNTHERRLKLIEEKLAIEGRGSDPADIIEAEDIKRKVAEINERIFRLQHGINDDEILYTYNQVLEITSKTLEEYSSALSNSFERVLQKSQEHLAIEHVNMVRGRMRDHLKTTFLAAIVAIPLMIVAEYFQFNIDRKILLPFILYIISPLSFIFLAYVIYEYFIKKDYKEDYFDKLKDKSSD